MKEKQYYFYRNLTIVFVSLLIGVAFSKSLYFLALCGLLTGMLILLAIRSQARIIVDERETSIKEKAAQVTYIIFAPTIGLGGFLLIVLARGQYYYLSSLGVVLAYLALFLLALYAISYRYFSKKYGGGHEK